MSDLDQVIGLCETIDNNSFLPYQNEDFAPLIAKKINSYYDLADKVINELKKRNLAKTENLNATPQKYGYTRYFKLYNMGVSLNVRFDFWERVADTPFWLCIKDNTSGKYWVQNEVFKIDIKNIATINSLIYYETNRREVFTPLFPLLEKTEDIVINDFADKIIDMVLKLKERRMNR